MSVDFQNGFLCGMATKGMLRSRPQYEPKLWNDEGVYTHFYIDFKRDLQLFSAGMFNESVVVFGNGRLLVTDIERVSNSKFKCFCDLSTSNYGVTVSNKADTLLKFASSGNPVPVFSSAFVVAGLPPTARLPYMFEYCTLPKLEYTGQETFTSEFWTCLDSTVTESAILPAAWNYTAQAPVETITITLI